MPRHLELAFRPSLERPFRATSRGLGSFLHAVGDLASRIPPGRALTLGYASYVIIGWLLLCLPFAQAGAGVSALDNLFVSTSAVSTTGLSTVSMASGYSLFGQIVILVLIQLGGIGYMTAGSFVLLSRSTNLSRERQEIGRSVFPVPEGFEIAPFLRSVVRFTLWIEAAGAIALYFAFRRAGVVDALWPAIFHSISAFCTAGFSTWDTSLSAFASDFWVNAVISISSLLGAIGFIVVVDFERICRRRAEGPTFTTKVILGFTAVLLAASTAAIFVIEPGLRDLRAEDRLTAAFFQAMSALSTVGFNTIDVAALSRGVVLVLILLMVIGSSPSGTGGGLKSTTFSAILAVMFSTLKGRDRVTFLGREIPEARVRMAVAQAGFYLASLTAGCLLLSVTETADLQQILFEASSALGTVGLSLGLTASLSPLGKLTLVGLMFAGRVGPLSLAASLLGGSGSRAVERTADIVV